MDEEDQIKTKEDLSRVVLKRSNGYIICLLNYKIYFFSGTGELLKKSDKFYNQTLEYYTFIPYKLDSNIFYFLIGFFDSNTHLNLQYYKFDILFKTFFLITSKKEEKYKSTYNFVSKSLSCEILYDYYDRSYGLNIVCFFIIYKGGNQHLTAGYYGVTASSTSTISNMNSVQLYQTISCQNVKIIKSESNYNLNLALVCLVQEDNESYCQKFYIYKNEGEFYFEQSYILKCKNEIYGLKVSYLFEKKYIIFSCLISDGGILADIYNSNLDNIYDKTDKKFLTCESIFGHSILYLDDYYVLSDTKCNGIANTFKHLRIEDEENTATTDINEQFKEEEEEEIEHEKVKEKDEEEKEIVKEKEEEKEEEEEEIEEEKMK